MSRYGRAKQKGGRNIEGRRAVIEALNAGIHIERIMVAVGIEEGRQVSKILEQAKHSKIEVEWLSNKALEQVSATKKAQGVIAVAADTNYCSVEEIIMAADKRGESVLMCVLDGIQDPHNLGAIARTLEAMGGHGMVIRDSKAAKVTPGAVRASAGAVEHLKVAKVRSIPKTLELLKLMDVQVAGLEAGNPRSISEGLPCGALALVVGSEEKGISPEAEACCDIVVSVPMFGNVGSLNVSVAAGITLFAVAEKRNKPS